MNHEPDKRATEQPGGQAEVASAWVSAGARPYMALALACGLVFGNTLLNGWTFDDHSVIGVNPLIRDFSNIRVLFSQEYFNSANEGSWRPVVTASYFLDAAVWGIRPAGFHLTNLLLHIATALLLLAILRRRGLPGPAALGGAAFFALHPAVCEAVNGVGFREDLLAGALGALAWLCFDGAWRSGRLALCVGGGVCLALAQLSKENSLAWGALLLTPWLVPFRNARDAAARGALVVLCLGAALAGQFWIFANDAVYSNAWPWGSRGAALLGAPILLARYILLILAPVSLSPDHPFPAAPEVFAGFAASGAALGLAFASVTVWLLACGSRFAPGWMLFVAPLAPTLGVAALAQPFAERFLYVPMLGAGWLAAEGLAAAAVKMENRPLLSRRVALCVFLALSALGARSAARNADWSDNESLFLPVLKTNPASTRAWQAQGIRSVKEGRYEEAAAAFGRVVEAKPDTSPEAWYQLGFVLGLLGRNAEAAEASRRACELWPDFPGAHINAALFYLRMQPPEKTRAAEHLKALMRMGIKPSEEQLREAELVGEK